MTASLPPASKTLAISSPHEYTVSELAGALQRTVEDIFGRVRLRGEISSFKRAPSGHLYFKLKDSNSVIEGVCWRSTAGRLRVELADGLEVIATGRLTTYAMRSQYQIVVEAVESAGEGALLKLLEHRRKQLADEGLFDEASKQRLPYLPEVIGVVTSPTGAVLSDILHRLRHRFPRRLLLWPVPVQGDEAAPAIARAIAGFNALRVGGRVPRPEVLIVARGGGSVEDLWAFNEEVVVRAAAASNIPLISAVGHETDSTLIDFAADVRAPTPTAAAELAVPVRADLVSETSGLATRLRVSMQRGLNYRSERVIGLARGLRGPRELSERGAQRLDHATERLASAVRNDLGGLQHCLDLACSGLGPKLLIAALGNSAKQLQDLAKRSAKEVQRTLRESESYLVAQAGLLESVSHKRVLARGYAVVRGAGGRPVTSSKSVMAGMSLDIELKDGHVPATAAKVSEEAGRVKRRGLAGGGRGQGSLL